MTKPKGSEGTFQKIREELELIKHCLENSDWDCERCSHPSDMTTTDIYSFLKEALAALETLEREGLKPWPDLNKFRKAFDHANKKGIFTPWGNARWAYDYLEAHAMPEMCVVDWLPKPDELAEELKFRSDNWQGGFHHCLHFLSPRLKLRSVSEVREEFESAIIKEMNEVHAEHVARSEKLVEALEWYAVIGANISLPTELCGPISSKARAALTAYEDQGDTK